MRNVVYLELTICRRPILFEHNCTSECAGECRFSANLCKLALDATPDVVVEATRNADMLPINASEDFH